MGFGTLPQVEEKCCMHTVLVVTLSYAKAGLNGMAFCNMGLGVMI